LLAKACALAAVVETRGELVGELVGEELIFGNDGHNDGEGEPAFSFALGCLRLTSANGGEDDLEG